MPSRIEDYALIGDCESAALVSRDGSIDWLCWPRFDSDACFAALLGTADNGRWRIAPKTQSFRASRAYRQDTLILETRFETDEGVATLIDFMPSRLLPCVCRPASHNARLETTPDLTENSRGRRSWINGRPKMALNRPVYT